MFVPLLLQQCPPGMKQQVLLFFTNLLGKMAQPLLPHVNVYKPVHVSILQHPVQSRILIDAQIQAFPCFLAKKNVHVVHLLLRSILCDVVM